MRRVQQAGLGAVQLVQYGFGAVQWSLVGQNEKSVASVPAPLLHRAQQTLHAQPGVEGVGREVGLFRDQFTVFQCSHSPALRPGSAPASGSRAAPGTPAPARSGAPEMTDRLWEEPASRTADQESSKH